jgi:two-component system, NtrC family, sensor kinase
MILEGLLVFARKSESVKRPGNLKKTLEDALLLVEKDMMRHEIKCDITLEEVPEISYDAGQISQVMMNMMNNSRDALKDRPNKQISLKLYQNEDKICMDIGDNGSGIPPQVLKRLFEPFVTSKPAGKGTGLGLSVCHGIIRNHGGEIKVTTAQDQGTTWHITLPKG